MVWRCDDRIEKRRSDHEKENNPGGAAHVDGCYCLC